MPGDDKIELITVTPVAGCVESTWSEVVFLSKWKHCGYYSFGQSGRSSDAVKHIDLWVVKNNSEFSNGPGNKTETIRKWSSVTLGEERSKTGSNFKVKPVFSTRLQIFATSLIKF
jgi:hypothetical protein